LLLINEGLKKSKTELEQEEAAEIILEWYRRYTKDKEEACGED